MTGAQQFLSKEIIDQEIFQLISLLNKKEKKQFIDAAQKEDEKPPLYVSLFQSILDLSEKESFPKPEHFPFHQNYLKNQLREFIAEKHQSIHYQVSKGINLIYALLERNYTQQAKKLIKKLQVKALDGGELELLAILNKQEITANEKRGYYTEKIRALESDREMIINTLYAEQQILKLKGSLRSESLKNLHDREMLDTEDSKIEYPIELESLDYYKDHFRVKRQWLTTLMVWYRKTNQFERYQDICIELADFYESNPGLIANHSLHYISALTNTITALIKRKEKDIFIEYWNKIETHKNSTYAALVHAVSYGLPAYLGFIIETIEDRALAKIEIDRWVIEYDKIKFSINSEIRKLFPINFCLVYFHYQYYELAQNWLKLFYEKSTTRKGLRMDLGYLADLVHLAIHLELGNYVLVKQLRTTNFKRIKRKEKLLKTERHLYDFFKTPFYLLSKSEKREAFRKGLNTLEEIAKDPIEFAYLINYYDWRTWFRNSIEK